MINLNRKNSIRLSMIAILSTLFIGCGSSNSQDSEVKDSNRTETQDTSVAGTTMVTVPSCGESKDSSNALKIDVKSKIVKQDENTKVRIWHYQDSTELVCVLSGKAVIYVESSNSK